MYSYYGCGNLGTISNESIFELKIIIFDFINLQKFDLKNDYDDFKGKASENGAKLLFIVIAYLYTI